MCPVTVGVLSLVRLSVSEAPVSLDVAKSTVTALFGGVFVPAGKLGCVVVTSGLEGTEVEIVGDCPGTTET